MVQACHLILNSCQRNAHETGGKKKLISAVSLSGLEGLSLQLVRVQAVLSSVVAH